MTRAKMLACKGIFAMGHKNGTARQARKRAFALFDIRRIYAIIIPAVSYPVGMPFEPFGFQTFLEGIIP